MPRKRKSAPQHLDAAKRQRETWNMTDMNHQLHIVNEVDAAETNSGSAVNSSDISQYFSNILPTCSSTWQLPSIPFDTYNHTNSARALELIYGCEFHLTIHKNLPFRTSEWYCKLGQFAVNFHHKPSSLPTADQFWFYVNEDEEKHLLYYEFGNGNTSKKGKHRYKQKEALESAHWEVVASLPRSCLDALQLKAFALHAGEYDPDNGMLKVMIMLGQSGVTTLQFSSEASSMTKKTHRSLQVLMAHFHGFKLPDERELVSKKENIEGFYDSIKQQHLLNDSFEIPANPQHTSLRPVLRPYQKSAVHWMLHKERYGQPEDEFEEKSLHCLYQAFTTPDGQLLYYNESAGMLVREKPLENTSPPGGILADEMGLGKTVEVLSCLLCHPRLDLPAPVLQPVIKREKPKKRRRRKKAKEPIAFSTVLNDQDDILPDATENVDDGAPSVMDEGYVSIPTEESSSSEVENGQSDCPDDTSFSAHDEEMEAVPGSSGIPSGAICSTEVITKNYSEMCEIPEEPDSDNPVESLTDREDLLMGRVDSNSDEIMAGIDGQSSESSAPSCIWNDENLMMVDGTCDSPVTSSDEIEDDHVTATDDQSEASSVSGDSLAENWLMVDGTDDHILMPNGQMDDQTDQDSVMGPLRDLMGGDDAGNNQEICSNGCNPAQVEHRSSSISQNVGDILSVQDHGQPIPEAGSQPDQNSPVSSPVQHDHNYMLHGPPAASPVVGEFVLIDGKLCQVTAGMLFRMQQDVGDAMTTATETNFEVTGDLNNVVEAAPTTPAVKKAKAMAAKSKIVVGEFVLIDGKLCQVTADMLVPLRQDVRDALTSTTATNSEVTGDLNNVSEAAPTTAAVKKAKAKAAKTKRVGGNRAVTDGQMPSTSKGMKNKGRKSKSKVQSDAQDASVSGTATTLKKPRKKTAKSKSDAAEVAADALDSKTPKSSKKSRKKSVRFSLEDETADDDAAPEIPSSSKKSKKKGKLEQGADEIDVDTAASATSTKQSGSKKSQKNKSSKPKQSKKNHVKKYKIVKSNNASNDCNAENSENVSLLNGALKQEVIIPDRKTWLGEVDGSRDGFECVCGGKGRKVKDLYQIQCEGCQVWQHAECLNYDTEDPFRGPYLCPHCHVSAPPIPSGATLIIAPSSISYQWLQEISKHIYKQRIKVFMYTGVHKQGFIQPRTLANHDIVVTTYETLRKEIDYVDLPHCKGETGRWLRHPKRFMTSPSPMIALEWWRVCLDEAQMVECTTTKTAEMALRLSAINRWCVTGTPVQRSIDDLHGLMLFLGVDPYWVYPWWKRLLFQPYCRGDTEPMMNVMSKVLWRTSKKDVIAQIELPAQVEVKHWLTFSPVEEHFYRQQLHECTQTTFSSLRHWTDCSMKLSSLDRNTLHALLHPLTRIRQACCHPQAVRGRFIAINKSTMTMEDLLVSLTKKARLECEEAHRKLVFADNALAGLHIIKMEYGDAVDRYRNVLRSIEEHKEKFRTDKLQLLHTLHNLNEVLTSHPAVAPPTLRDDQLLTQARELRSKYLLKAASFVTTSLEAWSPVRDSLVELQREFKGCEAWWAELLQWVTYIGLDQKLIEKVKEDLTENRNPEKPTIATSFRDVRGLQYILGSQLEQLQASHQALVTDIQGLRGEPSRDRINTTVECCLRPAKEILKICEFCNANEKFDDYEAKLFMFEEKGVVEDPIEGESNIQVGTKRHGTWADSEAETVLKTLVSFRRSYGGDRELIEQGRIHLQILDALKKEFKSLRMLWMALLENVQAYDELDMATMRLRLRLDEEELPEDRPAHIIEPAELDSLRMKYKSDYTLGTNELKKKLSQLLYLKNLAMTQNDMEGGENPESCPICIKNLGTKWSVLQCGHCYCVECIRILVSGYSCGSLRRSIRCPVCRQLTAHADIAYVSTRGKYKETNEIQVKGDHSTKVEGVVRCLLQIRRDEPDAKTLIFSTWADVLNILSRALDDNGINYRSLVSSNKFQEELWSFKQDTDISVLLMTVHSGANGLNLTEATHVILVEPILNPSQELQAIGRIHRIGQTKPTSVHRFLVRGTIEERMYNLQQTVQAPVNSHNSEETNMTIGDLTSLFEEMAPVEDDDSSDEPPLLPSGGEREEQPGTSGSGSGVAPVEDYDRSDEPPLLLSGGEREQQPSTSGSGSGAAEESNQMNNEVQNLPERSGNSRSDQANCSDEQSQTHLTSNRNEEAQPSTSGSGTVAMTADSTDELHCQEGNSDHGNSGP